MTEQDIAPEDPNVNYRSALTIWGQTLSVQVRNLGEIAVHHLDDAPRSTETGEPYVIPTLDAILLRDLLNAATARGFLPKPEGQAAQDAIDIGSRPTFIQQVTRAYQQGLSDARKNKQED